MNDVGNAVGLLIFALIAIGIFMAIRNFLLWYTGIGGVQQLLRDQIAETRITQASIITLLNKLHEQQLPQQQPPPRPPAQPQDGPQPAPELPPDVPQPPQRPPGTLPRNF